MTVELAQAVDRYNKAHKDLAAANENWKKDLDAYRWVYQQIGQQLSAQAFAILAPQELALRDYLVEFKIPFSGYQELRRV